MIMDSLIFTKSDNDLTLVYSENGSNNFGYSSVSDYSSISYNNKERT